MTRSAPTMHRVAKDACVDVYHLVQGVLDNNVYLVLRGQDAVVVDPSCDAPALIAAIEGVLGDTKPQAILLTHYHWDHVGAAADLRKHYGIPVVASATDAVNVEAGTVGFRGIAAPACPVDVKLAEGQDVRFGSLGFRVISTPGHTPGGVCYYVDGMRKEGAAAADAQKSGGHESGVRPVLLSGDTLFHATVGRTDFEDSNPAAMRESLRKLTKLPDETYVLPGHGDFTTIGDERRAAFAWYC